MDLLSAGDGGSRSWHSLLWHQWVAVLRAEAAVLAHDPRRSPPPRRSQSARRSQPDRGRPHPRVPKRSCGHAPSSSPGTGTARDWRGQTRPHGRQAQGGAALTRRIEQRGVPGAVRMAGDIPELSPYIRESASVLEDAQALGGRQPAPVGLWAITSFLCFRRCAGARPPR